MATKKKRAATRKKATIEGISANDFTNTSRGDWNVRIDNARIADAIESNTDLRTYLRQQFPPKTVEKVVEKRVEVKPDQLDPKMLQADEVQLIGEVLKIHEHRVHDETREDFIKNGGANWRELHQKAQVTIQLRQRLSLGEHVFATDCCVPVVEEADIAALAVSRHGIDVTVAAEKVKANGEDA